eukprot:1889064-Amphidinium_carterae.1
MSKAGFVQSHSTSGFVHALFEKQKELGRGSFGLVNLVKKRSTGELQIWKVVQTRAMPPSTLATAQNEVTMLKQLDHPNIVRLFQCADDKPQREIHLLLEYLAGGDCGTALREQALSGHGLPEHLVAKVMCQLLMALSYCHRKGVAHLDVKPENIVFTAPLSACSPPFCKLIDFGLSCQIGSKVADVAGTPEYMAPEVVQQRAKKIGGSMDIWSAAATGLHMLCGFAPFGSVQDYLGQIDPVFQRIVSYTSFERLSTDMQKRPSWLAASDASKGFFSLLLHASATARPHAGAALDHAWLRPYSPKASSPAVLSQPLPEEQMSSIDVFISASHLARCCQLAVTAHASSSKLAQVNPWFEALDRDGDGELSFEDLADGLPPTAEYCAADVLTALDLNHTGKVSFTAFAAACQFIDHGLAAGAGSMAFDLMDKDGTGQVTLREALDFFGQNVPLEEARLPLPGNRPFDRAEWWRGKSIDSPTSVA